MDQTDRSRTHRESRVLCNRSKVANSTNHISAAHHYGCPSAARPYSGTVKTRSRLRPGRFRHQRGFTIAEFMVAALLSIIVSGSAVLVLSNALGSNAIIMQRVQLSHELRNSMQMMSRDVRRAGYSAGAMWCLANTVCLPDASINLPLEVTLPSLGTIDMPQAIQINESNDCFRFELDRDQNGTVSADEHGAYRRRTVGGVGVLEVWMGNSVPDCTASTTAWSAITLASRIDISNFRVDDDLSIEQQVSVDLLGNATSQKIRRIRLQLTGRLVDEPAVSELLEHVVDVRNDILL